MKNESQYLPATLTTPSAVTAVATKMLLDGIPPTVLRDLFGHKDLATTMIYYHRIQRGNTEFTENISY